jgi:hypothetical protein
MRSRPIATLTALLAAMSAAAVLWSAPASAGDRYGYYAHPKHGYGLHRRIEHHHYHHPRKHRHRFDHRRHRGHRDGAYLLGGIVIGSILTHALTTPPAYAAPPRTARYETARYETARYETRVVGRRLFRDIHGNCFERRPDGSGVELLIELPAHECAW